jgi:hypothetical protein
MLSRRVGVGNDAGAARAATWWRSLTNGVGSNSGRVALTWRGGRGGVRSVAQPGRVSAPPSGWATMISMKSPTRRTLRTATVWPYSG